MFFSCRILQDTKVVCPFRENPPSTIKGCMSFSRKSSEHKGCMSTLSSTIIGLGLSVIIHDVNSRQDGVKSVGMLRPEGLMALTNENISRGCSTSSVLRRD